MAPYKRQTILNLFKLIYIIVMVFMLSALILSRQNNTMLFFFNRGGKLFGDGALLSFIVTLLPGIGERFGIRNIFLSIIKIYRRQVGILMYLFALLHVVLSKIIITVSFGELSNLSIFEIMGSLSLLILFSLFLTSNNMSLIRLRLNWYRIHRFTYMGIFFIFLHVSFISFSIWSVLMGLILILQLASFVVSYRKTGSLTGGKPI